MRIIRVLKQDIELFLDMDPLQMTDRLEFPDTFALAAVLEGKKGEDDPAGIIICRDNGKNLEIEWLYVSGSHRKEGIGSRLLQEVFNMAIDKGYTQVRAYLTNEYGRALICAGEEGYLKERYFLETRELSGEWRLYIRDFIRKHPQLPPEKSRVQVRSLWEIPSTQRRELPKQLVSMQYAASLYSITDQLHLFDPELSRILYIDGRLAGGILIQAVTRKDLYIKGENLIRKEEVVLYPVFMCIGSTEGLRQLLYEAVNAAAGKYTPDTEVRVIMRKGQYAPLLERMFPGSRIVNHMLTAQIEDYLEQRTEPDFFLSVEWQ